VLAEDLLRRAPIALGWWFSVGGEVHGDGVFFAVEAGVVGEPADEGKTVLRVLGVGGSVPAAGVGDPDAHLVVVEVGLEPYGLKSARAISGCTRT
jgi:hypothetical protein